MSKGNMLLGHARGKVGDVVFSRVNGQQITRSRAAVVKNPKTEAQMIQRIILNTISQAYSKMSAITDHSFEGVQPGQKSMSVFMRTNMNNLRQKIASALANNQDYDSINAFSPLGSNVFMPNVYTVAKGSLPEIAASFDNATTYAKIEGDFSTYQSVIDTFGLQRGDQITLIAVDGIRATTQTFHFARIILDPRLTDGSQADLSVPFIANNAINLPSPRNEGEIATISAETGYLKFAFSAQSIQMAGAIVSRQKSDGTWLRSNCDMALNESSAAYLGYSLQYCLDLAESGDLGTLSERYLNNAGTSNLNTSANNVQFKTLKAGTYNIEASSSATYVLGSLLKDSTETVGVESLRVVSTDDGNAVVARGTDGHDYYVASQNRSSRTYGKQLESLTGTMTSAWVSPETMIMPDFSTEATSVKIEHDVIACNGDNYDLLVDDQVNRLVALGMNVSVLTNN